MRVAASKGEAASLTKAASRPAGARWRRTVGALAVVALATAGYASIHLGTFLAPEDPISTADAVFVLGGTRVLRPLEAAELYREGYAPRIVLSRERPEDGSLELQRRGVEVPDNATTARDMLLQLGVPEGAVLMTDAAHDNTFEEMQTLRELVMRHGWTRVIVVSSKYHLRRAGLAATRALRGTGVVVIRRGARLGQADPARWWARRADIRDIASEVPKLVAYWLGVS